MLTSFFKKNIEFKNKGCWEKNSVMSYKIFLFYNTIKELPMLVRFML